MLNKVILMGRLTADPELKQIPNGTSTCQITIACDRNFVPQGGERQADFITVVAWRQTAEFISKYFAKGRMIVVEGNLRTRTYDDKRYPEVRHYVTEVYADQVYFGDSKPSGGGQATQPYPTQYNAPASPAKPASVPSENISIGNLNDFEEILSDGDVPF